MKKNEKKMALPEKPDKATKTGSMNDVHIYTSSRPSKSIKRYSNDRENPYVIINRHLIQENYVGAHD